MVLALVALGLYVPGLGWGLPGVHSWSQDTVAGLRTAAALVEAPEHFHGRYPPLHYWINHTLYKPFYAHWDHAGELGDDHRSGLRIPAPPLDRKVGALILTSRCLGVVMAFLAGLGVWASARVFTDDETVSLLSAIVLMIGAEFTYFAHLGNVDIPSMCWFAWSVYFYARARRSRRWWDCALLGVFAACAVGTKDGVAGAYPGMAVVLLAEAISRWTREDNAGKRFSPVVADLLKWLCGLAAFVSLYATINWVMGDFDSYKTRMTYWLDSSRDTIHAHQYRYPDQLSLALATIRYAAGAVGWPMVVVMAGAVVHTLNKHRRLALWVLLPVMSYYVLVIVQLQFVYARFLFPPLALLGVLVGKSVVDLVRNVRLPNIVRLGVPCCVGALSLGYVVAVDLEMVTDSRYQAEAWFKGNVAQTASVGAFSSPQYLPRLTESGYDTYAVKMARESFDRPQPEYLVLTSYNYEDFDKTQDACRRDLEREKLGYDSVAVFRHRFLGTGSSWVSLAGWGTERVGKISPTLVILRRTDSESNIAQHRP